MISIATRTSHPDWIVQRFIEELGRDDALATLALVALPYALGDRPTAVDRWWVYGLLAGVGALGLLLRALTIAVDSGGFATMLPDRAPGIWLAAAGIVGLAFATAELYGARPE